MLLYDSNKFKLMMSFVMCNVSKQLKDYFSLFAGTLTLSAFFLFWLNAADQSSFSASRESRLSPFIFETAPFRDLKTAQDHLSH